MRHTTILFAMLSAAAASAALGDPFTPEIVLKHRNAVVPGDALTITDFGDLQIHVDGAPPATTGLTLRDGQGKPTGSHTAVGLPMDAPLGAAITSGAGNFVIVDDQCSGRILAAPGAEGSTCELLIEPRAGWWGPITGNLRLSTGTYSTDIPLSGQAHHYDPLRLELEVVSGNPAAFDVDGAFASGNLFGGTPAYSAGTVTFRVTNRSTEYATPNLATILSNSLNFEFVSDGCSGVSVLPEGSCDMAVRAKATWWGIWAGTLRVVSSPNPEGDPDIVLSAPLAGKSHRFDPPRLGISTVSGSPSGMDVVGPAQPSYSGNLVLKVANLSTEFPAQALASALGAASGPGAFEFVSNPCSGAALAALGSCNITIRAKATWYGNLAATYTASGTGEAGPFTAAQALAGRAYHFDPARIVLQVVGGTPTAMNVVGFAQGQWAYSSEVTVRATNPSTEEATSALGPTIAGASAGNFEFTANGCAGAVLATGAGCDMRVRAKASANASLSASLVVPQHNAPSVALAGTASGFYTYGWAASGWGGCSVSCGGGSQGRSVWCQRSDGANLGDVSNVYPGCESWTRPGTSQSCNTHSCCTPNNYVYGTGGCSASCGGGWYERYWTNGCGSYWSDWQQCNTHSCGPNYHGCRFSGTGNCELESRWSWGLGNYVSDAPRCGLAPDNRVELGWNGVSGDGCSCWGRTMSYSSGHGGQCVE